MKKIPKFLQSYFCSYDIKELDAERDKRLIIQQILNWGTPEAVRWIFKTYNRREIKNVLVDPARGVWGKRSLNFWSKILDVHISRARYKKAILNVMPQF